MTLSKGIPRTYKVRETRIRQGKGIVVGFTVYWTIFGSFYTIIIFAGDDSEKAIGGWIAIWFAFSFLLCARGVADYLVWVLCVKQTELDFSLLAFCCNRCRTTTSARSRSLTEGLLPADSEGTDSLQFEESGDSFDDIGLNAALREELLFWTMLGLRTAASDADEEHRLSDPERGHGRPIDARDINLHKALTTDVVVKESLRQEVVRRGGTNEGGPAVPDMIELESAISKSNVRFTEYSPSTFLSIRSRFGIMLDAYKRSMSRHANAHFSVSGGGSGSFLFFTDDRRFLVKQINSAEFNTLLTILPSYHNYLKDNPETMLQRIYQLSSCQMYRHKLFFMVVSNVHYTAFSLGHELHERYDIKGSWINRNAAPIANGARVRCQLCEDSYIYGSNATCSKRPVGFSHVPNVTMKDMDLNYKLPMPRNKATRLKKQFECDTDWLCKHRIMDYSLYLGVHKRSYDVDMSRRADLRLSSSTNNGINLAFFQEDDGGIGAVFIEGPAVFYMGLIDILQRYDESKQVERCYRLSIGGQPVLCQHVDSVCLLANIRLRITLVKQICRAMESLVWLQ